MEAKLPGDYYITLAGMNTDKMAVSPRLFGISLPYSPEYSDFSRKKEVLKQYAELTQGTILNFGDKESEDELFQKSKANEFVPL